MPSKSTAQLIEALAGAEAWYIWVLEYGITHHTMRVAVHTGDYPRGVEVVCEDVTHFSGALQGGPYAVDVFEETTPNGNETLILLCQEI